MAAQVAGELYETLTGQLFEIGRQLRQPNGYAFDPHRLKEFLQLAIVGKFDGTEAPALKLKRQLLELVDTDMLDAIEHFIAKEKFREGRKTPDGVKLCWLGDNFKTNFLGKVEKNVLGAKLKLHNLRESSRDIRIITELGGEEIAETKLAQMWEMLKRQGRGESGKLLVNGYANIFYVRDVNGVLWAVHASWDSVDGGWYVEADSIEYPSSWDAGRQVVSR